MPIAFKWQQTPHRHLGVALRFHAPNPLLRHPSSPFPVQKKARGRPFHLQAPAIPPTLPGSRKSQKNSPNWGSNPGPADLVVHSEEGLRVGCSTDGALKAMF